MIRRRANPPTVLRCDFCRRQSKQVRVLVTNEEKGKPADRAICGECAAIAHAQASEYLEKRR